MASICQSFVSTDCRLRVYSQNTETHGELAGQTSTFLCDVNTKDGLSFETIDWECTVPIESDHTSTNSVDTFMYVPPLQQTSARVTVGLRPDEQMSSPLSVKELDGW